MAKKKTSAKKANVKKAPKKAVSKKSPKKVTKKTKTVKKAVAKKAAAKKAVSKSTAKVAKKPVAKKAAVKAPAKKAAVKKASAKAVTPKKAASAKTAMKVPGHLAFNASAAKPAKTLDLSGFVTPLDDRLMVQVSGTEKMTAGGLYIPDTVSDVSGNLEGYVVAVGRGHMNKKGHILAMDVVVGDRVVFSEYAGSKIKIQNEDLIILRESDVLGVVTK
ncbi:co-chaperone GroES [Bdellovibrio reynosensis]|uniref:Co-chaperonin GroES n=1 Tax=Bdellovibrio reynosensis TaxID=2835041 RepID=A0ABY4C7K3_9BACT|nr:co-chaperone GroES [Bdellovibrio reynosensis]UOF00912.1 co-chaperone GroES [Bdellovibrio reynosensis]